MDNIEKLFKSELLKNLSTNERWNNEHNIKKENVAEHSYSVVWITKIICLYLFEESNPKLENEILTYAIFHELDETLTGDINHNLKYNDYNGVDIRLAIDDYVNHTLGNLFQADNIHNRMFKYEVLHKKKISWFIVKTADWLAMLFYSLNETNLGNNYFHEIYENVLQKFRQHCDLTKSFIENDSQFEKINTKIFDELKQIEWKKAN